MIVIDHISKPFSDQNVGALRKVIEAAYEQIGLENLQIILFDDKTPDTLNIKPNHTENLYGERKTGFNPFFNSIT